MRTFSQRVVETAMMIPRGRVSTYGDIARASGGGGQSARSVTAILAKAYEAGNTKIPAKFGLITNTKQRGWSFIKKKR